MTPLWCQVKFAPACTSTLAIWVVVTELVITELNKFVLCYGRRRVQAYYQGTNNASQHNLHVCKPRLLSLAQCADLITVRYPHLVCSVRCSTLNSCEEELDQN